MSVGRRVIVDLEVEVDISQEDLEMAVSRVLRGHCGYISEADASEYVHPPSVHSEGKQLLCIRAQNIYPEGSAPDDPRLLLALCWSGVG